MTDRQATAVNSTPPLRRADLISHFLADLADTFSVDAWAWYRGLTDRWEIDWCPRGDVDPTVTQVRAFLASHPAGRFRRDIRIATSHGAAVRWARAMLRPGTAVILDTETTDLYGAVCEIAVTDTTGAVLLNTLVNPGVPIRPDAQRVHGITDADVATAPTWPQVLPRLLQVTAGVMVIAYKSDYDMGVVWADCERYGLDAGHLDDEGRWACAMNHRTAWLRATDPVPLGGSHRALGDCHAARNVLVEMTTPTTAAAAGDVVTVAHPR
ncbi:MAG: 3'-5' exonuclease [Pseudonocardia sp.]|nr:3'-5' exonuclease [Pseudonocardia sp.]